MRVYLRVLPIVLALATSRAYEFNSSASGPAMEQMDSEEEGCDIDTFNSQSKMCASSFKLNMPHNHGDQKFICSIVSKYKLCMSLVMRMTRCARRENLRKALKPVQEYMRDNHVSCAKAMNASYQKEHPVDSRTKLDLCTREKAWDTQFQCAKKFQMKIKKVEEDKEVESHQICRTLSRYYSCLNTVLHSEACEEDTELMTHMEYFPKVLSQRYRDMCIAELKLTALNVAKRLEGFQADQLCREEDATKEFFACGLLFNEIARQTTQKDQICTAYANFQQCTKNIENTLQCGMTTDFYGHAYHVVNVLLHQYESFCRNYIPTDHVVPPKPQPGPAPGPAPVPRPPSGCNQDVYMEKYIECGLMYIFNLRDAMYSDNPQFMDLACDVIDRYDTCLTTATQSSGCTSPMPVQNSLTYITDELKKAPGAPCHHYRRSSKIRFRASGTRCSLREFAGTYFTCGTIFIKNTEPTLTQDEKCRHYKDFMHCKDLLLVCRTGSDITAALDMFTSILSDGYKGVCDQYNLSVTCEKVVLLKNFFTCGLTYYQSYNEFGDVYKNNQAQLCKLSGDFINCTHHQIFNNDCKMLTDLFTHIKAVRKFIIQLFNDKQQGSCANPDDRLKKAYLGLERQTGCDQFKAVKKLVLCGVTFHKLLASLEANSSLVENNTSMCPLVKEMKYCLYSATHDSGCSESLMLTTEISVLKKHLLKEFEDVCNAMPLADDSEFRQYRQACELKEFTQQWDVCDAVMEDGIGSFYRNSSRHKKNMHLSNRVRKRLCTDLVQYRKCLNDSADRHHCSVLAPEVKDMSNELFDRLGLMYCSKSRSTFEGRHSWLPFFCLIIMAISSEGLRSVGLRVK